MVGTQKRTRSADETRALIVSEATTLFATRGYERTSLNAIAKSIGISAPALYYHFDSKDEILFATLETTLLNLQVMANEAVATAGDLPADQLTAFVRAHVFHDVGHVEIMPMLNAGLYNVDKLIDGLPAARRKRLTLLQREFLDQLRSILRAGKTAKRFRIDDITATAFAIIGMVDFAVYWFRAGGKLSVEQLADQYGELALRMVDAKDATSRNLKD